MNGNILQLDFTRTVCPCYVQSTRIITVCKVNIVIIIKVPWLGLVLPFEIDETLLKYILIISPGQRDRSSPQGQQREKNNIKKHLPAPPSGPAVKGTASQCCGVTTARGSIPDCYTTSRPIGRSTIGPALCGLGIDLILVITCGGPGAWRRTSGVS